MSHCSVEHIQFITLKNIEQNAINVMSKAVNISWIPFKNINIIFSQKIKCRSCPRNIHNLIKTTGKIQFKSTLIKSFG